MKKNVLVFPCGSEIGLEIHKSLNLSTHFNLFGGSSVEDHGRFIYKNYIGSLPQINDDNFTKSLNTIIDEYSIDYVFPAHDSVVLKLAQEKKNDTLHCDIITSPVRTCEIARSKRKTYETFSGIIPIPEIYKTVEELSQQDFPIFLKPDVGQGSKGTYLANSVEDVRFYFKKDPSLLFLEYLPGKEYTVDCFTDKEGKLLFCEGRERGRISNGISVNSSTVNDDRLINLAVKINQELDFRGVWFFQVKENSQSELVLMEIAPRVAGTMGLVRAKGVNLPMLSLFDAMGVDVSVFENNYDIVIDRALENKYRHNIQYKYVYLDFDDLVIFENKVNPHIMAFVYQCRNKDIAVYLLTRHIGNIKEALERFGLSSVFDKIIRISVGDSKASYIKESDALFIDDSFAERKEVSEKLGIPVFDAHMIESLME